MERLQALKTVLTIIILAIMSICFNSLIARADSTYNFFFNNGEGQPSGAPPQVVQNPIGPPPIVPRAVTPSGAPIEMAQVKTFRPFRLGAYFSAVGGEVPRLMGPAETIGGGSLTVGAKYFVSRYLGFFGEVTFLDEINRSSAIKRTNYETKPSDPDNHEGVESSVYENGYIDDSWVSFAVGAEVVPVHIDIFGADDLVELAAEGGWSTLGISTTALTNNGVQALGTVDSGFMLGAKARLNLGSRVALEMGVRKSVKENIWLGLLGGTINF
ncbi:MAG TPA: hypothetical protein VJL87_00765 [Bdellovibrionota bacterium]|nr:hypothetical protein [Bdellovibrionota bacterium]